MNLHALGMHYNRTSLLISLYFRTPVQVLTRRRAAKYWTDPHRFNPSRFLGDWPRDAFLPFSGGVRSCLGRRYVIDDRPVRYTVRFTLRVFVPRFAELESVAAITMLLQHYKITVKEEPQFADETFEQKKERVMKAKPGITLTSVVYSRFSRGSTHACFCFTGP